MFKVFDSDGNAFLDAAGYPTADAALAAYRRFRAEVPSYDDTVRIGEERGSPVLVVMPNGRDAYWVASAHGAPPEYECAECGSTDVEHAMWADPNTGLVTGDFGTWNEEDARFCNACGEHCELVECSVRYQVQGRDEVRS